MRIINQQNRGGRGGRSGFLLMESLLAFAIFGIAVTGIVVALNQTSDLSREVIRSQWAKQEARNLMLEVLTTPVADSDMVRDEVREIDDSTRARIVVEPFEAVNQDEEQLVNLVKVTVTLMWEENTQKKEATYSTIHYSKMFNQGR